MGSTISYLLASSKTPKKKTYEEEINEALKKIDITGLKTDFKSIDEQLNEIKNELANQDIFTDSRNNIYKTYLNVSKQNVDLLRNYAVKFVSTPELSSHFIDLAKVSDGSNFEELYEQFIAIASQNSFDLKTVSSVIQKNYQSVNNVCITVLSFAKELIKTRNKNWNELLKSHVDYNYVSTELKNKEKYANFDSSEVSKINANINEIMDESADELSKINKISISSNESVFSALEKINSVIDFLMDLDDDEKQLNALLSEFKLLKYQLQIYVDKDAFGNEVGTILNDSLNQLENMRSNVDDKMDLLKEYDVYMTNVSGDLSLIRNKISEASGFELVQQQIQDILSKISNSLSFYKQEIGKLKTNELNAQLEVLRETLVDLVDKIVYFETDEWLKKYDNLNTSLCLTLYNEFNQEFSLIENAYKDTYENYVKLITIDAKFEELFKEYKTTLIDSFNRNLTQFSKVIEDITKRLEEVYDYVNDVVFNEDDERLREYANNMLDCYYNIGLKSLEGKVGFRVYYKKYFNEYEKLMKSENITSISYKFRQCESEYNNINEAFRVFINNYNSFIQMTKVVEKERSEKRKQEEAALNEAKYKEEISKISPEIETKIDDLNRTQLLTNEIEKTLRFFKEDLSNLITENFMLLTSDDVENAVNAYYSFQSKLSETSTDIANVQNMVLNYKNSFIQLNESIEARVPIIEVKVNLANINTSILDEFAEDINTEKNDLMELYNATKVYVMNVYNASEELRSEAMKLFENTLSTYEKAILQFQTDVRELYEKTFVPLNEEMKAKMTELETTLTAEDSEYIASQTYWQTTIEEFVSRENQYKYKEIMKQISTNAESLKSSAESFDFWIQNYNESVVVPINALVKDFENSFNAIKSQNISFNQVDELYSVAIDIYSKMEALTAKFSQTKFDKLKSVYNSDYVAVKTSINDFFALIVEVNEEALLKRRNILRFTNAGKLLCLLFGKFYFGRINELNETFVENVRDFVSAAVNANKDYPLDVFETLLNYSPVVPLVWPTDANIVSTITSKCEYNQTTNTINYSRIYESIQDQLISYVQGDLIDYITKATVNSMNNIHDEEKRTENEMVDFLEKKCKECEDDASFVEICLKFFDVYGDDWKLLKLVSGKKTPDYNLVVLPNTYPKTNPRTEINEAIIIVLNRMFEWYGMLIDENGKRVRSNENITGSNIVHGGQTISFENALYFQTRMSQSPFDKYGFVLTTDLQITDGLTNLKPYNRTENYSLDTTLYKRYSNFTRFYDLIFGNGSTDLDSLLQPFSITNFIGLEDGSVKTIENLLQNIYTYLFGSNGKFALSSTNITATSLDYVDKTSPDGFKFYSLIYKYLMSNISNWKTVFPITKTSKAPYPSTKINNVIYNSDKHYLYECYQDFNVWKP